MPVKGKQLNKYIFKKTKIFTNWNYIPISDCSRGSETLQTFMQTLRCNKGCN